MFRLCQLVAIVAALVFATQCWAVMIYTDRTDWENDLVGYMIVNDPFDSDIAQALSITFDSGVISTSTFCCDAGVRVVNAVGNPPGAPPPPGIVYRGTVGDIDNGRSETTWDFPMPVVGFAADWFGVQGVLVTGNFDGTGDQTINLNTEIGGSDGFIGVIGNVPFSSIVLSERPPAGVDSYAANDLAFAKSAAVPEPSTMGLMSLGLVGLGFARRRLR